MKTNQSQNIVKCLTEIKIFIALYLNRDFFNTCPNPSVAEKVRLAEELDLSREVIRNWFNNYKAKLRREKRREPQAIVLNVSDSPLFVRLL